MKKLAAVAVTVSMLAGCASQPKATMLALNTSDPAYSSPDCMQARGAALAYNDNIAGRAGIGLALGLLGPIGLIGAVAMDANQNTERKRLNEIIERACTTAPAAPLATGPVAPDN